MKFAPLSASLQWRKPGFGPRGSEPSWRRRRNIRATPEFPGRRRLASFMSGAMVPSPRRGGARTGIYSRSASACVVSESAGRDRPPPIAALTEPLRFACLRRPTAGRSSDGPRAMRRFRAAAAAQTDAVIFAGDRACQLSNLRARSSGLRLGGPYFEGPSPWDNEKAIREELFGVERLQSHARSLAVAQKVADKSDPRAAVDRAARRQWRRVACAPIDPSSRRPTTGRAITPAAEWLIDNYHLVERQLRQIGSEFAAGLLSPAPETRLGPVRRLSARVRHSVGLRRTHRQLLRRRDPRRLYQRLSGDSAADDWRALGCLDHAANRADREFASARQGDHAAAAPRVARRTASPIGCSGAAGARRRGLDRLCRRQRRAAAGSLRRATRTRLRDQDPKFTPALAWLDARLAKQDMTADVVVREIHRSQGAANVTVRNIVTSLRVIAEVDWKEIFERFCLVDAELAKCGRFLEMDFATRTLYRSAVEDCARLPSRRA